MNITTDKDLIAAKTRLTTAKAEQAEIKLALMRKEYVSVSSVNRQWQEQAGRVKQRLLALPVRLAGMLAGYAYSQTEVENTTRHLVDEALQELAELPDIEDETE